MKQLHNKVNIVPVLAKADTLTKQEVAKLKRKVSMTVNVIYVHTGSCHLTTYATYEHVHLVFHHYSYIRQYETA